MYRRFNLDPDMIKIKEVPILIQDESWLKFYTTCGNLAVKRKYARLAKLLYAKEEAIRTIQTIKENKKESLNTVFMLSQRANNQGDEGAVAKMEEEKDKIEAFNRQLMELGRRKIELKEQIADANFSLLKETVRTAYREIRKRERAQKNIESEIEILKNRLNDRIDKKHCFEEEKNSLYRLVHALVGKEEANKLDKNLLE